MPLGLPLARLLRGVFMPIPFLKGSRQGNRELPPIQRAELLMWGETFERPSYEEMVLFDEPATS